MVAHGRGRQRAGHKRRPWLRRGPQPDEHRPAVGVRLPAVPHLQVEVSAMLQPAAAPSSSSSDTVVSTVVSVAGLLETITTV